MKKISDKIQGFTPTPFEKKLVRQSSRKRSGRCALDSSNIATSQKKVRGFTMPEMLISVGLFVIIITITSSAFLIGLRTQRQVIALLNANDNISYALEVMARDIRTGRSFGSPSTDSLTFTNYKNEVVVYRLNNDAVERAIGSADFNPLTSSNVRVLNLSFRLEGQGHYDNEQVRVTIIIKIASRYGNQEVVTDLETTISPRELES